ncbi:MAG TPA: AMP-binding protein, partial [Thermoanaerobaculia bacterium]|nr:AMP-binding protein [Thermoanaerobaculia bacterium]
MSADSVPVSPPFSLLQSGAVSDDPAPVLPDPAAPLDRPELPPVTALFAGQAVANPGATAVRQGERALTYGELAAAVSRLGGALVARGIEPGERVILYGRRSPGLVAGLLGVMAAGGAVLVVEPELPDERKARMIEIAGARRMFRVEPGAVPAWAADLDVVAIDPASGELLPAEEVSPVDLAAPRPGADPAYVFFTSGTSGSPKGVVGCFAGLSQFLLWEREELGIGPGDRGSQLTRLSFDAMLRDTFLPLVSGACLCLPRPEDETPSRVVRWLDREGITVLHAVPSLVRLWLDGARGGDGPPSELAALRWTLFTGEPLPGSLVRDWRRAFPRSGRQVNFYGPTETTLI